MARTLDQLSDLRDRVAIITGGGGHIGSTMAEALLELGATVVLVDLPSPRIEEAANRLRAGGRNVITKAVDLAESEDLRQMVRSVGIELGRIDILVNCAALVGSADLKGWTTLFEEQREDVWRMALDVNLTAVFVMTQACTPWLRRSPGASVINVSSIYGVVGPDWRLYEGTTLGNPAAYAASKGGMVQLTRWLATTLAPAIRVNAISPGGVFRGTAEPFLSRYVERTPMARMANEEDFKGAVAYLSSDLSAYVTGHNLLVDGGWTAW
ncbi:MAG TPA: SDR family oxidoreductase [Thermoanaerobaculia bacterium]|nr:SDR family oxidoreductase [Thermoanaerobaculia bacterium]